MRLFTTWVIPLISLYPGQLWRQGHCQTQAAAFNLFAVNRHDVPNDFFHRYRFHLQIDFSRFDPRNIQKIIDERHEPIGINSTISR